MNTKTKLTLMAALLSMSINTAIAQQSDENGFTMPPLNPSSKLAGLSGNHVGIRVPDYETAIKWYTEKLDFRIIHEWPYADEQLAYLAPANSNDFWIEILAGGKLTKPKTIYNDLGKSLEEEGYQHICMHVDRLNDVLTELKSRGVKVVTEPFHLDAIHRNLAFIRDPWGNMIEFAEVVRN